MLTGFMKCLKVYVFTHVLVIRSGAVPAEILLRSPRKLFILIIKNIFTGSKYPIEK